MTSNARKHQFMKVFVAIIRPPTIDTIGLNLIVLYLHAQQSYR